MTVCVISDVHGQAKMLQALIKKIKDKYPKAELHTVGDLIDRGPDSKGVIQTCIDENISGIIGNHEQYILELIINKKFDPYCLQDIMGGKATLESYGVDFLSNGKDYFPNGRTNQALGLDFYNLIPDTHKEWFKKLPPYRKLEINNQTYWLIHAGLTHPVAINNDIPFTKTIEFEQRMLDRIVKSSLDSILWVSPTLPNSIVNRDNLYKFHNAIQIFGHKPIKEVMIKDHFIALDTGCGTCAPYNLSAVILPHHEVIVVNQDEEWK